MPGRNELDSAVKEWSRKAEEDFRASARLLERPDTYLITAICFHAQQTIEKYVKALLVACGIHFHKTHEIEDLIALLPASVRPDVSSELQTLLTEYAVTIRYPGEGDMPTLTQARGAMRIARRVRSHVRRLLPRSALDLPA